MAPLSSAITEIKYVHWKYLERVAAKTEIIIFKHKQKTQVKGAYNAVMAKGASLKWYACSCTLTCQKGLKGDKRKVPRTIYPFQLLISFNGAMNALFTITMFHHFCQLYILRSRHEKDIFGILILSFIGFITWKV